ncbi:MAG: putative metallophosphoesterase [Alphaproteobacteria bacterium ADurb.Bin438]|nr:MAG: putative metallophosphoesterase [Alphaproteobacteria bacterium ADurb.Bin438]
MYLGLHLLSDFLYVIKCYPKWLDKNRGKEFLIFSSVIVSLYVFGYVSARITSYNSYDIIVNKPNIDLKVAVIADLHLGNHMVSGERLVKIAKKVNEYNPDLVLFLGDQFDYYKSPVDFASYEQGFKEFNAKLGKFAVVGNHEYYGDSFFLISSKLHDLGIFTLRDRKKAFDNFEIISRDDKIMETAKSLKGFNVDNNKLSIVLSHRPDKIRIDEAVNEKIDLMISGHTHGGQVFPLNLIIKYGFGLRSKKIEDTNLFISSGVGGFYPLIRLFTDSEVAFLNIKSN